MHIDWVVPSCADPNYPNNCSTPQVVNILAKPASNYAQFNTQVKENSQSSSQPTTSYGFATQASFGLKASFGIPDLVSAGVDVEIAGGEVYNNSVTTTTTSYESTEFDASVRTGFADHVWFGNYRFNVWTYPIIGKTACPLGKPNCLPTERLPLHLQISGPDQVKNYDLDGNVVEWYQPVWEPGNVLSYPWTEEQLLALLPRTYISNKSNVWAADSSGSNASVTWEQGGGQNISQATSLANNSDASISASAGFSIEGNGISASAGITHTDERLVADAKHVEQHARRVDGVRRKPDGAGRGRLRVHGADLHPGAGFDAGHGADAAVDLHAGDHGAAAAGVLGRPVRPGGGRRLVGDGVHAARRGAQPPTALDMDRRRIRPQHHDLQPGL